MLNLLRFILKNGAVFLFLLLQFICFWMIVTFNETQRTIFLHTTVLMTSAIQERTSNFYDFWNLYHISDSLAAENAMLKEELLSSRRENSEDSVHLPFTSYQSYTVVPAKLIYNSTTGRNNNLLINRGTNDGLDSGMGVLDRKAGLIGITRNCSGNYCRLISILHSQAMVSAKIKNREYFGSLVWKSTNPQLMQLEAIPIHARFEIGDTVVSSGYSTVFPEGIPIGIINEFDVPPGSNFFAIKIRLLNDLSKARYVYVASDLMKEEKLQHLNRIDNE